MITRIDPQDWEHANVVQLDSDARDNMQAMREIEDWAFDHGFARTTEYHLRAAITDDNLRVFRGICYRLTRDERRAIDETNRRVEERRGRMPVTSPED
jgi:hypothetical protein